MLRAMRSAPRDNVAATDPTADDDASKGYSAGSSELRPSRWWNTSTGIEFVCRSAAAGAAHWVPFGAQDWPGMVSGSYLIPLTLSGGAADMTPATVDWIYCHPFYFARRRTVDRTGLRLVTAAAGGAARLGWYEYRGADPSGAPLIVDLGEVDLSTGANEWKEIAHATAMGPGLVWGVVFSKGIGSPPTLRGYASTYNAVPLPQSAPLSAFNRVWRGSGVAYGALPSALPAMSAISNNCPFLAGRVE